MAEIVCGNRPTREINEEIRRIIAAGEHEIVVKEPGARHNLGVAVLAPVRIRFAGSVGYYCAGLIDGPRIEVDESAGWGLAESMMNGEVVVRGSVGNGAAAAIRGGTVVIHGDAAARLGVSMKGGTVLVAGSCGYMAAFMGQKGTLVVCGDAGDAFADSLYETTCFVGGCIRGLGTDAIVEQPSQDDADWLDSILSQHLPGSKRHGNEFKKIVAGRKLWNFDKREWKVWQEAL
jgi:methylamine---glutamate N-methyltransferase subunit B